MERALPSPGGDGDSREPVRADPRREQIEAEYALESPVRCHACGETVSTLKAVRLLRTQVNFTSTLPRRGRVIVCPMCHVMVPAELTNF
jgi:hypothetical protein